MNNLHPDVAENPNELVVYGGIGRAARSWKDFDRIVSSLKTLNEGKKIDTYHFIGDHLRFSNEFWKGKILPYLGN